MNPLSVDHRRIFIKDLSLELFIGVYEHEKLHPQNVLINCDIWAPINLSTSSNDNINDVLNYDKIVETIKTIATQQTYELQETLLDNVAEALLRLPKVKALRLSTEKTQAYTDVGSVGIEIFKSN